MYNHGKRAVFAKNMINSGLLFLITDIFWPVL